MSAGVTPAADSLARRFHEAYERLAPDYGYETRRESAVPWEQVPELNRALMVAVASEVLAAAEQDNERLRERVALLPCIGDHYCPDNANFLGDIWSDNPDHWPPCSVCQLKRDIAPARAVLGSRPHPAPTDYELALRKIAECYDPANAQEAMRVMYDIARSSVRERDERGRVLDPEWAEAIIARWEGSRPHQEQDGECETLCHCGHPAARRELPDPWEGRMDGYCDDCAWARCDWRPDRCPVKRPVPYHGDPGDETGGQP